MDKVYILKEAREDGIAILGGGVFLTEKAVRQEIYKRIDRIIQNYDDEIRILIEAIERYDELTTYLDKEFVTNDYITKKTNLFVESHTYDVMRIAASSYRRYVHTGNTYFFSLYSLKHLKKVLKEKKHNVIKLGVTMEIIKNIPVDKIKDIKGMNFEVETLKILG